MTSAVRLGRMLLELLPDRDVQALLALMLRLESQTESRAKRFLAARIKELTG
jgi:predicted RNA polymerase sigma factor